MNVNALPWIWCQGSWAVPIGRMERIGTALHNYIATRAIHTLREFTDTLNECGMRSAVAYAIRQLGWSYITEPDYIWLVWHNRMLLSHTREHETPFELLHACQGLFYAPEPLVFFYNGSLCRFEQQTGMIVQSVAPVTETKWLRLNT